MIIRKTRSAFDLFGGYVRFLHGLPSFLRRRMSLEEAKEILRDRMAERDESFLRMVREGVFTRPDGPYRTLFDLAGCSYADLERAVRQDGLEPTLTALERDGVYVTFDEFWARGAPIVRHGREIPVPPTAFENPFSRSRYRMSTGGSSGRPRSVAVGLEHLWARVPEQLVSDTIHGFAGIPTALWFDGLPGNAPNTLLTRVPTQSWAERWFTPTAKRDARPWTSVQATRNRLAEAGILATARLAGVRLPRPEPTGLDEAETVVRWVESRLASHGRCGVKTMLSRALRVCLKAEELGVDLTGLTISGGGEPPTASKMAAIERTGATPVCNYHFQEAGAIGSMCMSPVSENDQHLMQDHLAMITRRRRIPGFDVSVDAFCFTTLLPSARKLMINVETDDYGVVEHRDCGCPWEEFGFKTHLRGIRSFRKLTGEGVTLVGTDLVRILEEVLPSRFGGSALDYQFVEEEDDRGFTRMSVRVDPHIELGSETEVVDAVLGALPPDGIRSLWSQAGTLRVQRRAPVWTARGKLLPLHLERTLSSTRGGRAGDEAAAATPERP